MTTASDWPFYFVLTLFVELGVWSFWRRGIRASDVCLANSLSHPILFGLLLVVPRASLLFVGEVGVVLFEGALYARRSGLPFAPACAFSAFANLLSFLGGWFF